MDWIEFQIVGDKNKSLQRDANSSLGVAKMMKLKCCGLVRGEVGRVVGPGDTAICHTMCVILGVAWLEPSVRYANAAPLQIL